MTLVRTYNGGSLSFRTPRGTVQATLRDGFMCINVDPIIGRQMQLIHRFHKPPIGFSLDAPKKPEPKPAKAAPKKTTTRKTTKKTTAKKSSSKSSSKK